MKWDEVEEEVGERQRREVNVARGGRLGGKRGGVRLRDKRRGGRV